MTDPDQTPSRAEQISSALGTSPAEVAGLDRVLAGLREVAVARMHLDLAAHEAAGRMADFAEAWQASEERLTVEEAQQIAMHPDLAEVNVCLDALYDL